MSLVTSKTSYFTKDTQTVADKDYPLQTFKSLTRMRDITSLKMLWASYLISYIDAGQITSEELNPYQEGLIKLHKASCVGDLTFNKSYSNNQVKDIYNNFIDEESRYIRGFSYGQKKCEKLVDRYLTTLDNYRENITTVSNQPDLVFTAFKSIHIGELENLNSVLQVLKLKTNNDYTRVIKRIEESR